MTATALKAVADWTETYRQFREGGFDRLGEYLDGLQKPKRRTSLKGRR